MNLEIKTKRIRPGKYLICRSDGRKFVVLRGSMEWVIEAQDTLDIDGCQTLAAAKYNIQKRWSKATK